jgi:hypothetical protein
MAVPSSTIFSSYPPYSMCFAVYSPINLWFIRLFLSTTYTARLPWEHITKQRNSKRHIHRKISQIANIYWKRESQMIALERSFSPTSTFCRHTCGSCANKSHCAAQVLNYCLWEDQAELRISADLLGWLQTHARLYSSKWMDFKACPK